MSPLARVVAALQDADIRFAVIGAAALPALGVSRATLDVDLLTTDPRSLDARQWQALEIAGIGVDLRRGDADDPLLGLARFSGQGDTAVDLVVGRHAWQTRAVARARELPVAGFMLPVVRGEDLILLKLFAGGPQDAWDVQQALAGPQRVELVAAVERDLGDLPADARRLWKQAIED